MKFCKDLERVKAMCPKEWVPYWPNYKMLKKLIKGLHHKQPSFCPTREMKITRGNSEGPVNDGHSPQSRATTKHDSTTTPKEELSPSQEALILKHSRNECVFFKLLHAEMNKAIHFFEQTQLQHQLQMGKFQEILEDTQDCESKLQPKDHLALAQRILLLHQDLLRLETFAIMSYCAFSKILKKHDKVTGFHTRNAFMAKVVHPASITHTPQLQGMIQKCQDWLARMVDERQEPEQRPSETDQQLFWDSIQKLRTSSASSSPSLLSLLTREDDRPYRSWSAALALNNTARTSEPTQLSSASRIQRKRKLSELEIAI